MLLVSASGVLADAIFGFSAGEREEAGMAGESLDCLRRLDAEVPLCRDVSGGSMDVRGAEWPEDEVG